MANFVVTYNIKENDDLRDKIKKSLNGKKMLEQKDNQSTHYGTFESYRSLVKFIVELIKDDVFKKDDYITVYLSKENDIKRYRVVKDGEKVKLKSKK